MNLYVTVVVGFTINSTCTLQLLATVVDPETGIRGGRKGKWWHLGRGYAPFPENFRKLYSKITHFNAEFSYV